jgi:citrate lyase beta subunit
LHAAAQSQGAAVALDGQMIDKPVIERAQSVLARAAT